MFYIFFGSVLRWPRVPKKYLLIFAKHDFFFINIVIYLFIYLFIHSVYIYICSICIYDYMCIYIYVCVYMYIYIYMCACV